MTLQSTKPLISRWSISSKKPDALLVKRICPNQVTTCQVFNITRTGIVWRTWGWTNEHNSWSRWTSERVSKTLKKWRKKETDSEWNQEWKMFSGFWPPSQSSHLQVKRSREKITNEPLFRTSGSRSSLDKICSDAWDAFGKSLGFDLNWSRLS